MRRIGEIMTETIEFQSRIGEDGVLDLHVPLGEMAGADVVVTIRRVISQSKPSITDPVQWHRLADESYGSCADVGLDRPEQGEFETREPLE